MTLRRRIVLVVAAFVLLLFADAAVGVQVAREREDISARLSTIEPAQQATDDLFNGVVDQEMGLRGYVLTRDRAFLETYLGGRRDSQAAITQLRRLLADRPGLLAVVESVEAKLDEWQDKHAAPQLRAVRDQDSDLARELVDSARGEDLFEATRTEIERLDTTLDDRRQQAATGLRAAQERLEATVIAAAIAAVLLAVGVAWLLHRWISRPVEALSTAVEQVAGGSLNAPIPNTGPPELAGLGANVDDMRHRLLAQLDEAVRARQALEQQGPAVVSLRAALTTPATPLPGWVRVAATFAPARGVLAGDWYDVVRLDDTRIVVAVMDVSGHGPAAGVLALRAKELLGAALSAGQPPGEVLGSLAANLGDTDERFLTCFVAEVDRHGGVRYASAGHPAGLLVRPGDTQPLEPTGPLLGPLAGSWETHHCVLSAEDSLLVYTDGLLDARDEDGEPFGADRLGEAVDARRGQAPADLVSGLAARLAEFSAGAFHDDLTVVALSRETDPAKAEGESRLQTYPMPEVETSPAEAVQERSVSD